MCKETRFLVGPTLLSSIARESPGLGSQNRKHKRTTWHQEEKSLWDVNEHAIDAGELALSWPAVTLLPAQGPSLPSVTERSLVILVPQACS